jgi:hypothetical protein
MNNRRIVTELARHLARLESEGSESSAATAQTSIHTNELLSFRRKLADQAAPETSDCCRTPVRQILMTAVAHCSHERTPSMRERLTSRLLTRATAITTALLLAGSAVGASAAFGGPNLPEQALNAVGLSSAQQQPSQSTLGIKNAPDAAATGKENANDHASNGAGNATVPNASTEGINNAPDAAATGKEHANDHASSGSGNACVPNAATEGINNAPDAAATGKEHANDHAFNGAGNAAAGSSNGVTPNAVSPATPSQASPNAPEGAGNASEGSGNAPAAAQPGTGHAAPQANSGATNAPISIPTPPTGSGLGSHATTQHGH